MLVEQLEARTLLATLTLTNAADSADYVAAAGEPNNLTVSFTGTTYTFNDPGKTITVAGTLGCTELGTGLDTVTINCAAQSDFDSFSVLLGDMSDTLAVNGVQDPFTADGQGGTDTATLQTTASTVTGNVSITFDTINVNIGLTASGNVTLNAATASTQTAAISAAGLELLGTGTHTLTNAANGIATLAANTTEAINYRDSNAVTVGTVNTIGITTTADNVTIRSGSTMTLTALINVGAATVMLTVDDAGLADGNAAANNITATNAILVVDDGVGVGGNPIETTVTNLDVSNTSTGGIFVTDLTGGLILADLGGPNANAVSGVGGGGEIRASSPLTLASDAITTGGMTYTAFDSAAAGDNLTVNGGVTVQDTTAGLVLNAGDNLNLNSGSTVNAATTLDLNLDAGDADGGGETANINGNIIAGTAPITLDDTGDSNTVVIDSNGGGANNGGTVDNVQTNLQINFAGGSDILTLDDSGDATADTVTISNDASGDGTITGLDQAAGNPSVEFNSASQVNLSLGSAADTLDLTPNAGTAYSINGNAPPFGSVPGDTLNYPIPGFLIIAGPGAGTLSAAGVLDVTFTSIENLTGGPFGTGVNANADPAPGAQADDGISDTFLLVRSGANLQIFVNGSLVFDDTFADVTDIGVFGSGDNDTLTVDHSGGFIDRSILYTAGGQTGGIGDALRITGTPAGGFGGTPRETYRVGATEDAGVWEINTTGATGAAAFDAGEMFITFTGLDPADSDSVIPVFDVIMNAASNIATIEDGGLLNGVDSLQVTDNNGTFETFRFANKTSVRIMGEDGGDSFTVDFTIAAAGLETLDVFGHVVGDVPPVGTDDDTDNFEVLNNAALGGANLLTLDGNGGDDTITIGNETADFGSSFDGDLTGIVGPIAVVGGAGAGDTLNIDDTGDATASTGLLTNSTLTGLGMTAGVTSYATVEFVSIRLGGGSDTLNIQSTAAGTDYTVRARDGSDTVNISSDAAANSGSLSDIAGPIHLRFGSSGLANNDTLNVSDLGSGTSRTYDLSQAGNTTTLTATGVASIDYDGGGQAGELENFNLIGSQVGNIYDINVTSATVNNTVTDGDAAGSDDSTFNIQANAVQGGATNTFYGLAGNDTFNLNFASDTSVTTAAGTTLQVNGGDPAADRDNRDVVNIDASADTIARTLGFTYADPASGDVDVTGLGLPAGEFIDLNTVETLNYAGGGTADIATVTGTAVDDLITVAPQSTTSTLVFIGGDPFDGPPETFFDNRPGVAEGSPGPDMNLMGLATATGLTINGGGGANNTLFVYGESEADLLDDSGNVVIPGAGAGNAFDEVVVTDSLVRFVDSAQAPMADVLIRVNVDTVSFDDADTLDDDLIVNTGNEACPAGQADDIVATLSSDPTFGIQINGGDPTAPCAPSGDRLNVITPAEANVFSDKTSPPNVSVTSGGSGEIGFSSIERAIFTPGNGVVNLIGDNNDPAVDQTDNFIVRGEDVDGDATDAGVGEFSLRINGDTVAPNSPALFFNGVQFLNAFGESLNPDPTEPSGDVDTLEITPYADNTPRGWGIQVTFDESDPAQDDGAQSDLLIYNTVAANPVSEDIVVVPSGPENGELRVTNGAFGTPIVVVSYINNLDIVVNDNDGFLSDTDTLTLNGTNPETPGTSGQETVVADLTAAGDVANPMVTVSDTVSGLLLYRLRTFVGFSTLHIQTLDDNDQVAVNAGAFTVDVDAGRGNDLLRGLGTARLTLRGGEGDDALFGGGGADRLEGGDGNDIMVGGGGDDFAFGGAGSDTFVWNPGDADDLFEGDDGDDALAFSGANGTDNYFISSDNGRVVFQRTQGSIGINMGGVENIVANSETIQMSGRNEVPQNASASGGFANFTYNATTGLFDVRVFVTGLAAGDIADSHIHMNIPGANGPIVVPLGGGVANYTPVGGGVELVRTGLTLAAITPPAGFTAFDTLMEILLGRAYFNVHTAAFPGGEIRGNIIVSGPTAGSGGADTLTVRDLTGTSVRSIAFDAGNEAEIRNGAALVDTVTVEGLNTADNIVAAVPNALDNNYLVSGLPYNILVVGSDGAVANGASRDLFVLNGNGGDDELKAIADVENVTRVSISGGAGNDFLSADATLTGGTGDDTLVGGTGADSYSGDAGDDVLVISPGTDTMSGGADFDIILYQGTEAGQTLDLDQVGTIITVGGLITGTIDVTAADLERIDIIAGGGNDTIGTLSGLTIPLLVDAGEGEDDINGSISGSPTLLGGSGNDEFDVLVSGTAFVNGGEGADTIVSQDGSGDQIVDGGLGSDVFIFFGTIGDDTISITQSNNRVVIGNGASNNDGTLDDVEVIIVNTDASTVGGINDIPDTVEIDALIGTDVTRVIVNADNPGQDNNNELLILNGTVSADIVSVSVEQGDTIVRGLGPAIELNQFFTDENDNLSINGLGGDDVIKADDSLISATITFNGGPGNDYLSADATLIGGAGHDTLVGGAGSDSMDGGPGDDVFQGHGGTDTIVGGPGGDTILVVGTPASDTITLTLAGANLNVVDATDTTTYTDAAGTNISNAGVERVLVEAYDGDDTINVIPISNINVVVHAGGPAASDTLNVTVTGSACITQGADSTTGTVNDSSTCTPAANDIDYFDVEILNINTTATAGGVLTVRGTHDNDTMAAQFVPAALANTARVWTNDGTVVTLNNVTTGFNTLNVQGRFGDDRFSISPVGLPVAFTLNVDGGDPTASDEVLINGSAANETIVVDQLTADGARITGLGAGVTLTTTEKLTINGQVGNDTLSIVTPAGGHLVTVDDGPLADAADVGIRAFNGNKLLGTSFLNLGFNGTLRLEDAGAARSDELIFSGRDLANSSEIFTVAANGDIDLNEPTSTGPTQLLVTIQTPGIGDVKLNGLAGDDVFNVPGNHPFLNGVFVDGGDPSASDVLNFTGNGAGAVTVDLAANTVTEAGFAAVSLLGVEILNANAGGANLSILTTNGDDNLTVTPTTDGEITAKLISAPVINTPPVVNASNIGTFDVQMLAGSDNLAVVYTQFAETIFITPTSVSRAGLETVNYTGVVNLQVFGQAGNDAFNVTPAAATTIFVDGGDPIGTIPGDSITVNGAIGFFPGPESDEGGFLTLGQTVSFDHIEEIGAVVGPGPVGGCPFLIVGTNADDDITVIARDSSTHPGADGVQDFTFSINGFGDILVLNQPELFIDALSGDDDIVIRQPAPNDADWDVNVRVAGGPPSIGEPNEGDRLALETPGFDSLVYNPTGPDTGNLVIDEDGNLTYDAAGTDSIITFGPFVFVCPAPPAPGPFTYTSSPGGVELVEYDGELVDNNGPTATDDITINGTAFNDTTTVTPVGVGPGGSGQGSFVSPASPLFNFRAFDFLTVNGGAGGFDDVIYNATEGPDAITSDANSIFLGVTDVTLGAGIDQLNLNALDGNDTITLVLAVTGLKKVIDAGAGNDTVNLSGVAVDAADPVIFGGLGDDNIMGSPNGDLIFAGSGNDTVSALAGNDQIYGEAGDDFIDSDQGDDFLFGGDDSDVLSWDVGDGNDVNEGGTGDDIMIFNGDGTAETFHLFADPIDPSRVVFTRDLNVRMDIRAVEEVDLNAFGGADTVVVGRSNDLPNPNGTLSDLGTTDVRVVDVNLGILRNFPDGATDNVFVDGRALADNMLVSVSNGIVQVEGLPYDVKIVDAAAVGPDLDRLTVRGNDGDDIVKAAAGVEATILITLDGGFGDDSLSADATLIGGAGHDTLVGGAGSDSMDGGPGDDVFQGHGGTDTIVGGTGGDTILVVGTPASDTITLTLVGSNLNVVDATGTTTYTDSAGTNISNASVERVLVEAYDGDDTINVIPIVNINIVVNAGGPTASDTLNVTVTGGARVTQGAESTTGTVDQTGGGDIDYTGLELLGLTTISTQGAGLIVRGTDDHDTMAAAFLGGANRVWTNDGTVVNFANFNTLTIDGRFGDDKFSVSPIGVVGVTTINVIGGDPTASDELVVNGSAASNSINFSPTAADAGSVAITGSPIVSFTTTESVVINGLGGNDALTVTEPVGTEITLDAGVAPDTGTVNSRTIGTGSLVPMTYKNLGVNGSLTFTNALALRFDVLIVNPRDQANPSDFFTVTPAGTVQVFKDALGSLFSTVLINTPGIGTLGLNGLTGDDVFNIPGNHPFNGTDPGIIVDGGSPDSSDVINFTGSGGAVTVDLEASTVAQAGFTAVNYRGVETINLNAGGVSPTIVATSSDDDINVTVLSATSGKVERGFAVQQDGQVEGNVVAPVVNYSNTDAAGVNIDLAAGEDTLVVVGNSLSQTFTVNGPLSTVSVDDAPVVGNDGTVTYANNESLAVYGLEGNDTFIVTPHPTMPIFIDGGDPIGISPPLPAGKGDVLVPVIVGPTIFSQGPEPDEGGIVDGPNEVISFDHIEKIGPVIGPGPGPGPFPPVIIVGTNGDDDITVIARDSSTHPPLANGVQDFTVSVNAGPEILFIDQPALVIDALSGDDDIVLRTPAPNNAAWNVDVTVIGGPPSAVTGDQGDVFELETPGAAPETVVYTPNAPSTNPNCMNVPAGNDIAEIDVTTAAGNVADIHLCNFLVIPPIPPLTFPPFFTSSPGGIEEVVYDGEGDDDSLTIVGDGQAPGTANTIVHTPGSGPQEGTFRVDSLLGIRYQNLGAAAILTANGAGGADTLVVEGTPLSDLFTVAATTGSVTLNDRLAVNQAAVENLRLEGFDGDDDFILNYSQPYAQIAVNGAGPNGSDVLTINGADGVNEAFTVNPGAVPGEGNVTVNAVNNPYTGIEHIILNANVPGTAPPDNDDLVVNDDGADNLWTVNAGPASADRIQIAGRESIDYTDFNDVTLNNTSGTDKFEIHPTNLDEYTGVFTVNGDAATLPEPVDDVLELIGTPGNDIVTSPAVGPAVTVNGRTITAGANLVEVRVLTLDGNDNINLDLDLPGTGVRKLVDAGSGNDIVDMLGSVDADIFGMDGDDTITGTPAPDSIYGGKGDDILIGAGGNDMVYGEEGNDLFGNPSATTPNGAADDPGDDRFFGGDGSDTFVWEPGDGNDTDEGGSEEADVLNFFGSGAAETFNIFAKLTDPARAILFRSAGSITIDMAGVDQINVNGQGGADRFVVGRANDGDSGAVDPVPAAYTDPTASLSDLSTTEVRVVNVDVGLDVTAPFADNVFVDGRPLDDNILISLESAATGVVRVAGLPYDVRVRNSTTADRLTVRGNEGDDEIKSINPTGGGALSVETVIGITLAGGADNDVLSADAILIGGIGDDFLEGGAGADLLFGNQGNDTMFGGNDFSNDFYDGGSEFDTILVHGTQPPADERIDFVQTDASTLQYVITDASGFNLFVSETELLAAGTVEEARIEAGAGADVIKVMTEDSLFDDPGLSLRISVIGGDDSTRDRLLVVDDNNNNLGTNGDDLTVYRKGESDSAGTVTIGPLNAEPFEVNFTGVEFTQFLDSDGFALNIIGNGRLVVFKHDPYEFNDDRFIATFLGSDDTINVDPTIDPGFDAAQPLGLLQFNFGLPGDQDWFRVVAETTGTLDFQVYFEEIPTLPSGRPGLPGNGDLDIEVFDVDGTPVPATFGVNNGAGEFNIDNDPSEPGLPFFENERIRIPAVAGQTYYVRVFGRGLNSAAINNYNMTIINEAPPVPYDIELDDLPLIQPFSPFEVCTQVNGLPAGEENSDSGRSQFDDVTCDRTPTIRFRIDRVVEVGGLTFLEDVQYNDGVVSFTNNPPDEIIRIPFNASQSFNPVGLAPGFRIAIFEEGQPQQPSSGAVPPRYGFPQEPLGFATPVAGAPGVFEFTFPALAELCPNPSGGAAIATAGLCDGSHFISAKVQMIDVSTTLPTGAAQTGYGDRSVSLEIVVDAIDPTVVFGDPSQANDGLDPASDSGVTPQSSTVSDDITNDTTPTFFGWAEANTVIRLWLDLNNDGLVNLIDANGDGILDAGSDRQLAETVAVPQDGTNQFPNGYWVATSNVDLNDPSLGLARDGRRRILVTAEDLAGNISAAQNIEIFIDTQGPQVTGVFFDPIDAAMPLVGVFNPKPFEHSPTPLTNTIHVDVRDLPARFAQVPAIGGGDGPNGFQHPALNSIIAVQPGNYQLTGDLNGIIEITSIIFFSVNTAAGVPATGFIELNFATPLPDDRYTLTMFDRIVDDAGNALDGESNTQEPTDTPVFPTGDGNPGDSFIARFTVDSRPEVGTFCCGSWYIDLNQNGSFDDPNNHDTDATNGDIVFKFGLPGDFPVVGDWDGDGFDEIGVYGRRAAGFQFELDINGNGTFDAGDATIPFNATGPTAGGRPVAGAWLQSQLLPALPGQVLPNNQRRVDHVAVFNGTTWFADLTAAPYVAGVNAVPATSFVTAAHGRPIAADFNGDGDDDVGLFQSTTNVFSLDYTSDDDFQVDTNITFGFNTPNQWPVAADWDADRDGNIGLFVTDRSGMFPSEAAEWYLDLGVPFTGPLGPTLGALFGGGGGSPIANPGDGLFQPEPTGGLPGMPNLPYVLQDIFYQFGDAAAEPVVGNFDPPAAGEVVTDPIIRPLVRLDHADTAGPDATPIFQWDGTSKGAESGSIETPTDRDVFRFTPAASGRIAIDATKAGSNLMPSLTVLSTSTTGKRPKKVKAPKTAVGHAEISVVAGQTYYFQVNGFRGSVGDYAVSVDYVLTGGTPVPGGATGDDHGNTAQTGTRLNLVTGTTTRSGGKLATSGDVDFFVFSPTVNGRLDLNVAEVTKGLNTAVDVYDSNGVLVATNDDAHAKTRNSRVTIDVVASQTYSIRVRAMSAKRGDYSVAVDLLLSGGI